MTRAWPSTAVFCVVIASGCWDFERTTRAPDSTARSVASDSDLDTSDGGLEDTETESASEAVPEESPCEGVRCNAPPQNSCETATKVRRFSREGYCVAENGIPRCEYVSYVDPCIEGACLDGVCPNNPAQGKHCFEPPASTCEASSLLAYYPHGVAEAEGRTASCIYSKETIRCAEGCEENRCVGEPCAGVSCVDPPARYCRDDTLVKWAPIGRCDRRGRCVYDRREIACEEGCEDGACVEENRCLYAVCRKPPANFCLDDDTLYAYDARGRCREGACIYAGAKIPCPCVNGQCESDRCLGVECVFPPPSTCTEDGKLEIWDGAAWGDPCDEDGVCAYETVTVTCDQGPCVDGQCPDFCEGRNYYCDLPAPPDFCDGDDAVVHDARGSCHGTGHCEWESFRETCANGCELGVCL